jgi:hypothetical protein
MEAVVAAADMVVAAAVVVAMAALAPDLVRCTK